MRFFRGIIPRYINGDKKKILATTKTTTTNTKTMKAMATKTMKAIDSFLHSLFLTYFLRFIIIFVSKIFLDILDRVLMFGQKFIREQPLFTENNCAFPNFLCNRNEKIIPFQCP